MVGKRYNRLLIIVDEDTNRLSNRLVVAECDCGSIITAKLNNIKSGNTKSCGCYKKDRGTEASKTHGQTKTRLYTTWLNLKVRCNKYGPGRYKLLDIKMCKDWEDFTNFYIWAMSSGYEDNLTIDRIDNCGDYTPSNCRWITQSENSKKMWDDTERRVVKDYHISIASALKRFGVSYSESARNFKIKPHTLIAAIHRHFNKEI